MTHARRFSGSLNSSFVLLSILVMSINITLKKTHSQLKKLFQVYLAPIWDDLRLFSNKNNGLIKLERGNQT